MATSLEDLEDHQYHALARSACDEFARGEVAEDHWHRFRERISYVPGVHGPTGLARAVEHAETALGGEPRHLHYLSIPPHAAAEVVQTLDDARLTSRARVIMEKPFGTDLPSARRLNAAVEEVFTDDQIFRIDHFLGKEPAQNILAFRFANGLFEPIWNREHIDHVQIDVPETLGVGGRAGFYEADGRLPRHGGHPPLPDPGLRGHGAAHRPRAPGHQRGEEQGLPFMCAASIPPMSSAASTRATAERGRGPDSDTETFVALRCEIDNWRWAGVPFFLRTGKRMAEGARIVSIAFREPPKSHVPARSGVGAQGPDHLTFDLADAPSCRSPSTASSPVPGMKLDKLSLQFALHETEHADDVSRPTNA